MKFERFRANKLIISDQHFTENSPLLKALAQAKIKISVIECDSSIIEITYNMGIFRITQVDFQSNNLLEIIRKFESIFTKSCD